MDIEAKDDEEAVWKARHFLGLNPTLERAIEHTKEASELFQRVADLAREGEEIAEYLNAAHYLKAIANQITRPGPRDHYESNIIDFHTRQKVG